MLAFICMSYILFSRKSRISEVGARGTQLSFCRNRSCHLAVATYLCDHLQFLQSNTTLCRTALISSSRGDNSPQCKATVAKVACVALCAGAVSLCSSGLTFIGHHHFPLLSTVCLQKAYFPQPPSLSQETGHQRSHHLVACSSGCSLTVSKYVRKAPM